MKLRGLFAALCLLGHLLAGPGALAFLCSMDGGLHAAPCCPEPAGGSDAGDAAPLVGTRSCCELTAPAPAAPPATADRPPRLDPQPVLAFASPPQPLPVPVALTYRPRPVHEPDPGGPPIFVRHCALLI